MRIFFSFTARLLIFITGIRHITSLSNSAQKNGLRQPQTASYSSRRFFIGSLAGAWAGLASKFSSEPAVAYDETAGLTNVYFGVGCFWHVQHEFIEAERKILGRSDKQLTSMTGYAGGTKTDKEGRVCYHNFQGIADYGKLGHGEVVGMSIPDASIGDFAKEYFALFSKNGERADPMDKGGEYRSIIGIPGGATHEKYPLVEALANQKGLKLEVSTRGNDPDTLGKKLIYVYDSNKFPFHQAEIYHQFHDDFLTPPYGKTYNSLVEVALDDGLLKQTGCPDRF